MSQQLKSSRFPFVPFRLEILHQTCEEEALLDTGFDGDMAVPPSFFEGQEPDSHQYWKLADETLVPAPVYGGIVRLGDFQPIGVNVIGLGVLNHFSVLFDHGKSVTVNL